MITLDAVANALWSLMAFGIVAGAVTPLPAEEGARAQVDSREHEAHQAAAMTEVQLERLHPARTARGIVFTLVDASFDVGSAALKANAIRPLDEIALFLRQNPERHVLIEGFTDSHGSSTFNLELSQSRADAVAMALIQRGVEAPRLGAVGLGARFPVASEIDEHGRERNRRVEVTVTRGAEAIPFRVFSAAT